MALDDWEQTLETRYPAPGKTQDQFRDYRAAVRPGEPVQDRRPELPPAPQHPERHARLQRVGDRRPPARRLRPNEQVHVLRHQAPGEQPEPMLPPRRREARAEKIHDPRVIQKRKPLVA